MKTGIIIITYNLESRIFLLQMEAIRKFCKDDFEIQIVDNSSKPEMALDIEYHSQTLGLNYIRTAAASINGTDSHAFAANVAYSFYMNKYEYLFFIDHDCIPVKDFSVKEILGDNIMGGLGQGVTTPYFWAGCVMWNNGKIDKSLINFSPNHDLKIDTGGELRKVINTYGKEQCVFFDEEITQNPEFTESFYNFYCMIYKGTFMHFINSSNWNPTDNNQKRLSSLINIAKKRLYLHI